MAGKRRQATARRVGEVCDEAWIGQVMQVRIVTARNGEVSRGQETQATQYMNESKSSVNVNPAIQRAKVGDIVQKTSIPNIGCTGIIRSVDETSVIAVNRSPRASDPGADVFTLEHGQYVVIGRAVVFFPRDPEEPRPARFNTKPEEIAALNAEPANSEAIDRPTDIEPPQDPPTPRMPQPPPQPPSTPQTPGPSFIPKVTNAQREVLGGITVSGQPAKPPVSRPRPTVQPTTPTPE